MKRPKPDLVSPQAALDWFRKRVPMTDTEWKQLSARAKKKAFTVAGVAQLDLVTDVYRALEKAIEKGEDLAAFKRRVREKLAAAWGGDQPHRVDTIFRTNVQMAYSQGRRETLTSGPVARRYRYWKFSAVLDSRTSDICRPLGRLNIILPAGHPWWNTHTPPLHHACRSAILPVTFAEAKEAGITTRPPKVTPDEGFGRVDDDGDDWTPDLREYPNALVKKYKRGQ